MPWEEKEHRVMRHCYPQLIKWTKQGTDCQDKLHTATPTPRPAQSRLGEAQRFLQRLSELCCWVADGHQGMVVLPFLFTLPPPNLCCWVVLWPGVSTSLQANHPSMILWVYLPAGSGIILLILVDRQTTPRLSSCLCDPVCQGSLHSLNSWSRQGHCAPVTRRKEKLKTYHRVCLWSDTNSTAASSLNDSELWKNTTKFTTFLFPF